jgi:signal transduction histidine kinase
MLATTVTPGASAASLLPFWDQIRDLTHASGADRIEVAHGKAIIEVRSLLIHDERTAVIGRLMVLHDVTERAQLVRELTAYARTIAHDLKNPLSGAIGFLGLVRADEPNLDEESERRLGEAEGACHQMVSIIVDLLRTRPDTPASKQQSD